jgi:hypothetical protein
MPLNVIPAKSSGIAYGHRVRPENMSAVRAEGSQARGRILDRRAPAGIGRVGKYAHQRIFSERTRRPSAPAIAPEPGVGRPVMQVLGIEQRHQNVYVEQSDHALSNWLGFVTEPVDDFRRDDSRSSLLGQNRHAIALARGACSRRQGDPSQLGENPPRGSPPPRGEFLGAFEHVLVNIERSSH